ERGAGVASPDRPSRDRRSEHRDRHAVAAPRRRVRGVPLRDRAREADRADLEARVLRRRRRLDRGRDGGSRRCARESGGGAAGVRVTVKLFARLRDIAGSSEMARDVAPGATIRSVWRELAREFPELANYERSISSAVNADYAKMDQVLSDGDEVAFLPPVSGG